MNSNRVKIIENLVGRANAVNFPVAVSGLDFVTAQDELFAMRQEGLLQVSKFPLPGDSAGRETGPEMFRLTEAGRCWENCS